MDEAFMEAAAESYTKGVDVDLSAPLRVLILYLDMAFS